MKNWHCSYSKKMQLAIASLWIVSLPIPLFSMQAEQAAQEQTPSGPQETVQPTAQAQQQPANVMAPAAQAPETVEPIEKIGTQGNWVKKREWLIKAHEVTNEIQEIVAQTEVVRKSFIDAYNEIDVTLDKYYQELGLGDGKIQGLFDNIKRYLEKKQKKEKSLLGAVGDEKPDPVLQAKIDSIDEAIKPLKQQLSQLKLDMKSIEDLDRSLTDRIKRVDEQIGVMQDLATSAKNTALQMWDIIDHNKARENYYDLKLSTLEKIKASNSYLKEDLFKDFESVIGTIKTQITRTQDQIKKLEADGLFIKDRAQRIKEFKLNPNAKPATEADEKKESQKDANQKGVQASSLLSRTYNILAYIIAFPLNIIVWIKEKIVGTPQVKKTEVLATQAPEQQSAQPTAAMPQANPLPSATMQIPQAPSLMTATANPDIPAH